MTRQLLTGLFCVAVMSTATFAQTEETIKVTSLTDKLYLLTTDQGSYTTNSLAFAGEDGLLLEEVMHKLNLVG